MGIDSIAAKSSAVPPVGSSPLAPRKAAAPSNVASGDGVSLQSAKPFNLPGVAAGSGYKVDGSFRGHGFGGKADVNAFDGNTLDTTVNASAMLFIKVKVHLRFEAQPDGTVLFVGERLKGQGDSGKTDPSVPQKLGTRLSVVSKQPGQTVMQAPDGNKVTVTSNGKGGFRVTYGAYAIGMAR